LLEFHMEKMFYILLHLHLLIHNHQLHLHLQLLLNNLMILYIVALAMFLVSLN
jgi:hypothetical protein